MPLNRRLIGIIRGRQGGFRCADPLARARGLSFGAVHRGAGVAQQAMRRLVAGGKAGGILSRLRQQRFTIRQDRASLSRDFGRLGQTRLMTLMGADELLDLPLQPRDRLARVSVQPGLALHITAKLGDAALQGLNQGHGAGFLFGQGIALQDKALQNGSGNRLFLALGRQGVFARLAGLGGSAGQRIGLTRRDQTFAQDPLCLGPCGFCFTPATEEQHPLTAPQFFANLAVARGLTGLSGQGGDLLGKSF